VDNADRDDVARVYDAAPEEEWSRLESRRVEFGVTCLALDEFLPPPPARILDVGCGPGRYAIHLARAGYHVSLVDVSRRSLELATAKASEAGVSLGEVVCASAENLSAFQAGAFDAVLSMGPLYHLRSAAARRATLQEALRVTRHGGTLLSAHLNRYSVIRYIAKVRPWQLAVQRPFVDSILSDGVGRIVDGFLGTCYCAKPDEIQPFVEDAGWDTVAMIGCEGVVAEVEERINELDPVRFADWVALNYRLGQQRDLLAASAHILHIGRKR
jgi:S-adenosylmethionine-dependent methyltransferase